MLRERQATGLHICVGLDSDADKLRLEMPDSRPYRRAAIEAFTTAIVEATLYDTLGFKPNLAFYQSEGAEEELAAIIDTLRTRYPEVPVILDGKWEDIGNTAKKYAKVAFDRFNAHAATVECYLGDDTVREFATYDHGSRGVFVLCRTSNPSAPMFQGTADDADPLYLRVARQAVKWNQEFGNIGLVVGATYPRELEQVREIVGLEMPILVPGVGSQGGSLEDVLLANHGGLIVINASRSILFASKGDDFAEAAAAETKRMQSEINEILAIHAK